VDKERGQFFAILCGRLLSTASYQSKQSSNSSPFRRNKASINDLIFAEVSELKFREGSFFFFFEE